jgi:hypothetical protein
MTDLAGGALSASPAEVPWATVASIAANSAGGINCEDAAAARRVRIRVLGPTRSPDQKLKICYRTDAIKNKHQVHSRIHYQMVLNLI